MPIKSCTLFVIILLFSFQGHTQIENGATILDLSMTLEGKQQNNNE